MDDTVRFGEPAGGVTAPDAPVARLDRLLTRAARLGAVALALLLAVGLTTGDGGALLTIVAVTAGLAVLIARAEDGEHRRRVLELTWWAAHSGAWHWSAPRDCRPQATPSSSGPTASGSWRRR